MKLRFFAGLMAALAALPAAVRAHCPLCTAATGSLVLVSRFYGVDDMVVSTFIGAFIISTAMWANRVLKKRNNGMNFIAYQPVALILASLALTIWGFQTGGLVSEARLFGLDKIVAGVVIGSIMTVAAYKADRMLRIMNGGKHFMPFQVIVVTVALLVATVAGYYISGVAL